MSAGGSARWQHGRAVDRAVGVRFAIAVSISVGNSISVADDQWVAVAHRNPHGIAITEPDRRFHSGGQPVAHGIADSVTHHFTHDCSDERSHNRRHTCARPARGSPG